MDLSRARGGGHRGAFDWHGRYLFVPAEITEATRKAPAIEKVATYILHRRCNPVVCVSHSPIMDSNTTCPNRLYSPKLLSFPVRQAQTSQGHYAEQRRRVRRVSLHGTECPGFDADFVGAKDSGPTHRRGTYEAEVDASLVAPESFFRWHHGGATERRKHARLWKLLRHSLYGYPWALSPVGLIYGGCSAPRLPPGADGCAVEAIVGDFYVFHAPPSR